LGIHLEDAVGGTIMMKKLLMYLDLMIIHLEIPIMQQWQGKERETHGLIHLHRTMVTPAHPIEDLSMPSGWDRPQDPGETTAVPTIHLHTQCEVRQAPICTFPMRISHVQQGCQEDPMTPMRLQMDVSGLSVSHGLMEHSPSSGAFEEDLHLYLTKNWPPWRSMQE
jgi:hypothetical protein